MKKRRGDARRLAAVRASGDKRGTNADARPFRYYESLISPDGRHYLVIHHSNMRPSTLEALMADGAITNVDVSSWSGKLLRRLLTEDDLRSLAWALNLMRVTRHVKDASSDVEVIEAKIISELNQRIEKGIGNLTQDLRQLIEWRRRHGVNAKVLENLLRAMPPVTKDLVPISSLWGVKNQAPWHVDALYLVLFLEAVAKKAGKRVSFTKDTTPGVEFVDKALNRAGVRHSRRNGIARAIARYNAEVRARQQSTAELGKGLSISTT